MNIGIFSDSMREVNGVTRVLGDLIPRLRKQRHTVVAFGPGDKESSLFDFPFPPCPEYRASIPDLKRMYAQCKKEKIQVLHAHTPFSMGIAAVLLKKSMGLPSLGTFHTLLPEYLHYIAPVKSSHLKQMAWNYLVQVYSQFEKTTCPSEAIRKELSRHGIRSVVVPNGIDTRKFSPSVSATAFCRKLKEKPGYFISVGRVAKEKRLEWMVRAAQEDSGSRFVIGGRGPELETLKVLAPANVRFTGYLDEKLLPSAYQGAGAFIMCSQTETQGLVCLEAMACGTPVLAYDCPTNRETIDGAGLFFTDIDGLIECMRKVQEPNVRKRLSQRARKVAERNSIDIMVQKYVKLYSTLV